MLHKIDPDSNTDSSGKTDIQQNNAANFIMGQGAANTEIALLKTANREDSPFVTNKGILM